jgi:CSLREA domain-containing protein
MKPLHFRHPIPALCAAALLLLGAGRGAGAATLTVTNLADNGPGTLRQHIADTSPGDIIDFAVTGTITLTSGELVIHTNLTIQGPGATKLTISRDSAAPQFGVLVVSNGVVRFAGLTIRGGNAAFNGGGIRNRGVLSLDHCVIANCVSGSMGGGIFNGTTGHLTVSNSAFVANQARNEGGGLVNNGVAFIVNCTFASNFLTTVTINQYYGSAILSAGSLSVSSSTFAYNRPPFQAAPAIWLYAPAEIHNSILAHNGGSGTPEISGTSATNASGDYNLVFGQLGPPGTTLGGTHNKVGTGFDMDPRLGELGYHGRATPFFPLTQGSPAIDAGNCSLTALDQTGTPRPLEVPGITNASDGCDIGSIEYEQQQSGSSLLVTTLDDHDDGMCGPFDCSLREAINLANQSPPGRIIEFRNDIRGMIQLRLGQLEVLRAATIRGPGSNALVIRGNGASRVFYFDSLQATSSVSGLTISGGVGQSPFGGPFAEGGGGIYTRSPIVVIESRVTG